MATEKIECSHCGGEGGTWYDAADSRGEHETRTERCNACDGTGTMRCGMPREIGDSHGGDMVDEERSVPEHIGEEPTRPTIRGVLRRERMSEVRDHWCRLWTGSSPTNFISSPGSSGKRDDGEGTSEP